MVDLQLFMCDRKHLDQAEIFKLDLQLFIHRLLQPQKLQILSSSLGQEHLPFMFLDKRVGTLEPRSFLDPVHHSLLRPSTMSNIPSPLWRGVVASHIPHTVLLPWSWLAICLPMLVFMH